MTLTYGRSPRGTRVPGLVPRRRWEGITLLASLTSSGLGPGLQIEGAIDRDAFDHYVRMVLVPTLRPGQVVICDNLAVHKSAVARAAIESAACQLLFLPPYSPDFNPIEQAFSKLKQHLRRAASRTTVTVMAATQTAYPLITAADARGYFRHAGYKL
jgi:transposase